MPDWSAGADANRGSLEPFEIEGLGRRRVVAAFDGGVVTSEAGVLLLRHGDRAPGLIEQVAASVVDGREQDQVVRMPPALARQRSVRLHRGRSTAGASGAAARTATRGWA